MSNCNHSQTAEQVIEAGKMIEVKGVNVYISGKIIETWCLNPNCGKKVNEREEWDYASVRG